MGKIPTSTKRKIIDLIMEMLLVGCYLIKDPSIY